MFDDFIACARHLIKNNYTSSPRLVTEGHSNGGLLVLGAMVREPELFGTVIAGAPVADMLAGQEIAYKKEEYGDPYTNKADFESVIGYSPLHNIKKDQQYPPCLIRTGAHDTMLLAGALKFAATMQHDSPQSTMLLHVEEDFGHGTARPKAVEIKESANKKSFIVQNIGAIDQAAYKQELALKKILAPEPGKNTPVPLKAAPI